MTLLESVGSLGIVDMLAPSSIFIRPVKTVHVARFTMALLLPLNDPALPDAFRTGLEILA
jgi:hypothetical protein